LKKTQKKLKKQGVYCQVSWETARAAISLINHLGRIEDRSRAGVEITLVSTVKSLVINLASPGPSLSNASISAFDLDEKQSVRITWLYVRVLLRLMISVAKKTYALDPSWKAMVDATLDDLKATYKILSSALEKSDLRKGIHWKLIEEPLNLLTKILESNGRYHGSLPRYLIEVLAPIAEIKILI